jgi:hypothetical protein
VKRRRFQEIAALRLGAEHTQSKIISETLFMMNGFPAVDIVMDSIRVVLPPNRRIFVSAGVGSVTDKDNPSVRRFFDSFKLLPAAR